MAEEKFVQHLVSAAAACDSPPNDANIVIMQEALESVGITTHASLRDYEFGSLETHCSSSLLALRTAMEGAAVSALPAGHGLGSYLRKVVELGLPLKPKDRDGKDAASVQDVFDDLKKYSGYMPELHRRGRFAAVGRKELISNGHFDSVPLLEDSTTLGVGATKLSKTDLGQDSISSEGLKAVLSLERGNVRKFKSVDDARSMIPVLCDSLSAALATGIGADVERTAAACLQKGWRLSRVRALTAWLHLMGLSEYCAGLTMGAHVAMRPAPLGLPTMAVDAAHRRISIFGVLVVALNNEAAAWIARCALDDMAVAKKGKGKGRRGGKGKKHGGGGGGRGGRNRRGWGGW